MTASRDAVALALLAHHTVQDRPNGPVAGCECGRLGWGQSWSFHVADELQAVVDGLCAEALEQAADAYPDHFPSLRKPGENLFVQQFLRARAATINPSKEQQP